MQRAHWPAPISSPESAWGCPAQSPFLPVGVLCATQKWIWLQNSILTTIFHILYCDIYNISPKALLRLKEATICTMLALFPCWLTVKLNQFIACMLHATHSAQRGWAYSTIHPSSFLGAHTSRGSATTGMAIAALGKSGGWGILHFRGDHLGFWGELSHLNVVLYCWVGIIFTAKSVSFDVNYLIQITPCPSIAQPRADERLLQGRSTNVWRCDSGRGAWERRRRNLHRRVTEHIPFNLEIGLCVSG